MRGSTTPFFSSPRWDGTPDQYLTPPLFPPFFFQVIGCMSFTKVFFFFSPPLFFSSSPDCGEGVYFRGSTSSSLFLPEPAHDRKAVRGSFFSSGEEERLGPPAYLSPPLPRSGRPLPSILPPGFAEGIKVFFFSNFRFPFSS